MGWTFCRSISGRFSSSASAIGWSRASPRLARAQNITSVADFVAARYGKAQNVAAMVALIAVIGAAPYIALQLKAIAQTIMMMIGSFEQGRLTPAAPSSLFFLAVALLLAAFAMAFGTRRIDPTEHQDGLILAIAAESLVKLVAFLAVGAFVVWGMFGGLADLARSRAGQSAHRRGDEDAAGRRCLDRHHHCCRRWRSCCCRASFM